MSTRRLDDLRTEARQLADMEADDTFVTDTELNRYINVAYKAWWDLLIECELHEWLSVSTVAVTVTNGSGVITGNFNRLLGVDCTYGGVTQSLRPYNFHARNAIPDYMGVDVPLYYRLTSGLGIKVIPAVSCSLNVHVIPEVTELVADADKIEGFGGWEEYVVVDAAIKMKTKEESDTTALQVRKQEIIQRIRTMAGSRHGAFPDTVTDVTGGI